MFDHFSVASVVAEEDRLATGSEITPRHGVIMKPGLVLTPPSSLQEQPPTTHVPLP